MSILEEAIHASRMRRRDVRCFRYVQATPAGVHETAEDVIILQSVRDIAPASAEKLVLLDHEIHFHPLRGRLLVPAATSRKVLKVNRSLHRDQALMLTGLLEYCQLQQDRCIIHEDNGLRATSEYIRWLMACTSGFRFHPHLTPILTLRSQLVWLETLLLKMNLNVMK